jgi:mRNA interferase MazF
MADFGAIVLVPFPFTDLSATKVRPALVVSKTGRASNDVIVCFITSRTDKTIDHALHLQPTSKSGLKVPSLVRFDKIATLDRGIILGELGKVDPVLLRKHKKTFLDVFGF